MLDSLISSKTRIKLLIKFFINARTTAYLRNLETEFGESTNAIRLELNRFETAGLLESKMEGNKKVYQANIAHPYFREINGILLKFVGIDHVIDEVINKVGHLVRAFVTGDFAKGKPGNILDIALIGDQFDYNYLNTLVQKAEETLSFKIRYITILPDEENTYISSQGSALLVWSADK